MKKKRDHRPFREKGASPALHGGGKTRRFEIWEEKGGPRRGKRERVEKRGGKTPVAFRKTPAYPTLLKKKRKVRPTEGGANQRKDQFLGKEKGPRQLQKRKRTIAAKRRG